jgi:DNA-binding NtrC family response regulator
MQTSAGQPTSSIAKLALLGQSPAMERLRAQLRRIGPYFRTALITGEPGTGTPAVAEALHALSPAAGTPLITEISEHPAHPGSLFLPELSNLSPMAQNIVMAALRRGVRILAATEHSPRSLASAGRLHRGLYTALSSVEIAVPPLRNRLDDLEELTRAILGDCTMSAGFLAALKSHPWTGNLIELEQVLHEAMRMNGSILENLPDALRMPPPPEAAKLASLQNVIDQHVFTVLNACAGNKLRAAEVLGISRSTLYRMLANNH